MKADRLIRSGVLAAGLLVASLFTGCTGPIEGVLAPNQRPTLELTQAPVNTDGEYFYAYRINWSGYDSDGQVLYYEYAIDPPTQLQASAGQETLWVRTERQEQVFFFRASIPDPSGTVADTARDFHVFVIRAVDNSGNPETMRSPNKSRAFYSYTVAPTVQILRPIPSRLLQPLVTPAVRISWQGSDPDGQFTQKPVKYKYRLFRPGDVPSIQTWTGDPDSLRRFYGPEYFAGWDSTSAETTTVQFTNLTPGQQYLFVLVGFDEAGAFSPEFNLDSNMLLFNVGFANTNGPRFSVFNSFFFYRYPSGGYTTDPLAVVKIEAAAGVPFDCAWFAEPPSGSLIEWYRWGLDLADLTDETPRTSELNDWYHWSQKSPATFSCRVGPFPPGERHTLYIEGQDNNGLRSLAIVEVQFVGAPRNRELLIVDDTRLSSDQFFATSDPQGTRCLRNYTGTWPAAAELDTFLYARGNVMWRGLAANCPTNPPNPVLSTPGVFAGYEFDTLGTRQGFETVSNAVPLSILGQYKRIIWMVDGQGAQYSEPLSPTRPMTALRFMSQAGRANTLAAFANLGGQIWMLGGASGYASLIGFNRTTNDQGLFGTVFSSLPGNPSELVASRMMFDAFHWRSEFITGRTQNRVIKSEAARGGWSHPNRDGTAIITAPDYNLLPAEYRRKTPATDPVPVTRPPSTTTAFYQSILDFEYLTSVNFIIEDVDPDPDIVSEQSTLDTLFALDAFAGNLHPNGDTYPRPVMTYYHGSDNAPMVFSGFNIWSFARQDVIQVVDFVLQQIWGLPRQPIDRQPGFAARPAAPSTITTPAQQALRSRLPVGRTRGE